MTAGESAYDVARRQREKAERLQKSAALWEQGAEGEVAVARALAQLPGEWVVLHDLPWPGRQRANLDHVAIGPGGVLVVDAKNWSGRIDVRDDVLTQDGRRREQTVASAAEAAVAVRAILPPQAPCTSVLCFVSDEALRGTTGGVLVCSTQNLVELLTSRPVALAPDDVRRCADAIRGGAVRPLTSSRKPARAKSTRRGRPVVALVGALLLMVALLTGGLTKASEWFGEQLVSTVDDGTTKPPPAKHPKQDEKQRVKKQQDRER